MPIQFTLRAEGSKLDAAIVGLGQKIQDWREAWPAVSDALRGIAMRQLASQGAGGRRESWAPLSPEYARRKQKKYPGQPILQASTRLWQSLVGTTQDTVEDPASMKLRFGTRVEYAGYLQSGTGKGFHKTSGVPTGRGTGRGMAQRMMVDSELRDEVALAKEFERQASHRARGLGFGLSRPAGGPGSSLSEQL